MLQLHAGSGILASGTVTRHAGLRQGRSHVRLRAHWLLREAAMDWDELKPKPAKGVTSGGSLRKPIDRRTGGAHRGARGGNAKGEGQRCAQKGARGRGHRRVQALRRFMCRRNVVLATDRMVDTRLSPPARCGKPPWAPIVPLGCDALPFVIQSVALSGYPVLWIRVDLSTPFDASLLTPEPPQGGSFFVCGLPSPAARRPRRLRQRVPRRLPQGKQGSRAASASSGLSSHAVGAGRIRPLAEDVHKLRVRHTTVANQRA